MTILVTGATGTVGRSLVEQLLAEGHPVRALTRRPDAAALPAGVEVVGGDLADVASVEPALAGVTAAHLITFAGDDHASLQSGPDLVAALEQAGVTRVTVLGGWDTSTLEPALEASPIAMTLLCPVEFMANTLAHAEAIRSTGEVRMYDGGRRSAAVHEADIAAVALAVLTGEGHGGQSYVITGGEAVTTRQKLAAVGAATGIPVTLTALSGEQARADMAASGADPEWIDFTMALENDQPEIGSIPRSTVLDVTGRPPRTFAQWAVDHAEAFRA